MPVLINKETGLPEDLDQSSADSAISNQTHEIPLIDPQGNFGSAPVEDAKDLISQGYAQPNTERLQQELDKAKFTSTPERLKAAAEEAAKSATFGLSTGVERALGVNPEDIRKREELSLSPGEKFLAGTTGLLGSTLIPGIGEANLLEAAGKVASEAVGASGIVGDAVRGAFEGALLQGGNEVSKAFAEDPEQHAQSVIANIGLQSVLGGVVGGTVGSILRKLQSPAVEEAQDIAEKAVNKIQKSSLEEFKLERGAKALGFIKNQLNKLKGGEEEAKDITNTLLKAKLDNGEKIITPLSSTDQIATKVERLMDESGQKIGNVYKKLDEAGVKQLNPLDVASKIDAEIGPEWRSPLNRAEVGQLENTLDAITMRGDQPISFEEANVLKQELSKAAYPKGYWGPDTPKMTIARRALGIFNKELDSAVDKAAEEAKIPGLLDHLQEQRKLYGASAKADRAINDLLKREVGNNIFGLSDVIIGTGAGAGGGAIPGIAAVTAKKLIQKYGNQIIAATPTDSLITMEKIIRSMGTTPEIAQAGYLGKATVSGLRAVNKSVKSIFNEETAMPIAIGTANMATRDKLKDLVNQYSSNPNKFLDMTSNIPVQEYQTAFASTATRAVQYLNSIKPNTAKPGVLDPPRKPSRSEEYEYDRAVDIADKPLTIIGYIKSGTLTSKDVITLRTIYPQLYKGLQDKVYNSIIDNSAKHKSIPYRTRLSLSLFLGTSLDSTMTPQAILAAQPKSVNLSQQQQMPQMGHSVSMKALGKFSSNYQTPDQSREALRAGNRS